MILLWKISRKITFKVEFELEWTLFKKTVKKMCENAEKQIVCDGIWWINCSGQTSCDAWKNRTIKLGKTHNSCLISVKFPLIFPWSDFHLMKIFFFLLKDYFGRITTRDRTFLYPKLLTQLSLNTFHVRLECPFSIKEVRLLN